MKISCLIIFAFGFLSCAAQDSVRLQFQSAGFTMTGYLYKPAHGNKFPVIALLHSASDPLHTVPLYQHIKKNLLQTGTAVFLYDRRGSGESGGNFSRTTITDQALDGINALKMLKARNDIVPEKMGLLGISQGAWVAPIAYQMDPSVINMLVLISMSGVSPALQMKYGTQEFLKSSGFTDPEDLKHCLYLRETNDEYYSEKIDKATAQPRIDKYKKEPWFPYVYLPNGGNLPDSPKNTKYFKEMDYSPGLPLTHISVPTIFFYGSYDMWVPIDKSIETVKTHMAKSKTKEYEIFRLRKGGHMMTNDVMNSAATDFSDEFTGKLKSWIQSKTQRSNIQ